MIKKYYSHGKLLLTGEYVVLDGAKSHAIPTKKGQLLEVSDTAASKIKWQSFLHDQSVWIDTSFDLSFAKKNSSENPIMDKLQKILVAVCKQRPALFEKGTLLRSTLEFDRSWGLGSSSTLISNIAQWAQIDPYALLKNTFGGSGYDIACASANGPITFLLDNTTPKVNIAPFNPSFKEELFFVHLNKKQNSRESIKQYRETPKNDLQSAIKTISEITDALIVSKEISEFEELLAAHENLISYIIKTPTIKQQLFSDYQRPIKSLGGWGGDFVLAICKEKDKDYFRNKGFTTILSYKEMAL